MPTGRPASRSELSESRAVVLDEEGGEMPMVSDKLRAGVALIGLGTQIRRGGTWLRSQTSRIVDFSSFITQHQKLTVYIKSKDNLTRGFYLWKLLLRCCCRQKQDFALINARRQYHIPAVSISVPCTDLQVRRPKLVRFSTITFIPLTRTKPIRIRKLTQDSLDVC